MGVALDCIIKELLPRTGWAARFFPGTVRQTIELCAECPYWDQFAAVERFSNPLGFDRDIAVEYLFLYVHYRTENSPTLAWRFVIRHVVRRTVTVMAKWWAESRDHRVSLSHARAEMRDPLLRMFPRLAP